MMGNYVELTSRLMEKLREAGLLKIYRSVWMARAEMSARDQIGCNDPAVMNAIRGQLTICFEQADAAHQALEEESAKANAQELEGLPEV